MIKSLKLIAITIGILVSSGLIAVEKPTISLAGIETYRPYSYMQDGRIQGLYNDIVREIFRRAGYEVKIFLLPFKRLLSQTKAGQVTGMIGTFYTERRNTYALYINSVPLTEISHSLFVLKDSALQNFSYLELKGKRVAKKRGFITSPEFEQQMNNGVFQSVAAEDIDQIMNLLLMKRVDAFNFDAFATSYYLKKYKLTHKIRKLTPAVTNARSTFIAFSRKSLEKLPANFIEKINTVMLEMQVDGTLQRLRVRALKLSMKH